MSYLLPQLTQAAQGLLFISESESPLEPFSLPTGVSLSSGADFLKALGMNGQPVEQVELAYFFRNMVRTSPDQEPAQQAIAQRFIALLQWLETNLQEVRVYRVGQIQVQAYVMGKAPDGTWLGLKMTLVET
ncbi:nuclease A inhibitor family protein [Rufibacter latericius]|uniref:Sugar-non-specific nuclease inhibitor NuiA-like protein n=1 Tax=Rufibacter latericius TaxID=2487040 RepID=A0A3M9MN03_9BACT|nr:nuclease A inhibitor family protein [Rufibacter latericius]RNI26922.1 sugar-non-specific nuclease inhibitor NuiA-like protein [Rufibacter latericius]